MNRHVEQDVTLRLGSLTETVTLSLLAWQRGGGRGRSRDRTGRPAAGPGVRGVIHWRQHQATDEGP